MVICALCVCWLSLFTYLLFFSFLSLLFQPFQTPFSAVHKKFMSQSLRNFRSGTVVSNDHETPRTVPLCIFSWLFLQSPRQLWKFKVEKGLHVNSSSTIRVLCLTVLRKLVFQACTSGWRCDTKCRALAHTRKCAFFHLVSVPCFVASANAISQETFCHLRHVSDCLVCICVCFQSLVIQHSLCLVRPVLTRQRTCVGSR